jgi:hypothetical protein
MYRESAYKIYCQDTINVRIEKKSLLTRSRYSKEIYNSLFGLAMHETLTLFSTKDGLLCTQIRICNELTMHQTRV